MEYLFEIFGIVAPSSQRGRELGFPTANLNISTDDLPVGIYLAYTHYEGRKLPSLLFIGTALTFGDIVKKAEVYILEEVDDWYGREIKVEALKKIRENMKFNSAEELITQMQQDEKEARNFFESLSLKE